MLDLLFETSWEVCNKVGGIYAVLSTKAKTLQAKYKDKVIFIGPDLCLNENDSLLFKKSSVLLADWKAQAELPPGMNVRIGRWKIPGEPIAILVDYRSLEIYKNSLYKEMWEHFQVDSLHAYGDYDQSCMFAYGAALVIESIVHYNHDKAKNIVAHFDEWTTGMGLLYVKMHLKNVATVFTTHATSIGRSICGNGKPLYDYMTGYNGDQMAGELNMQSKHSLEKAAAHAAHAFTTVSEVTARECNQLLERRPMVTPNAFEHNFVPRGQKFMLTRNQARMRLLQVAKSLTGENYGDDTLLMLTSGRSEFRNKGLDVIFDSLNMTRQRLAQHPISSRKMIMFIMVPGWTDAARTDLLAAVKSSTTTRLNDPIITHFVHQSDNDAIYNRMKQLGMQNGLGETLKIIYVPSYLNGDDGIFNKSYYDLLIGMDLSIFPSYYEPWGYTPLESAAFGVPTITTDLAGFGQWVLNTFGGNFMNTGVKVIHRTDSNYGETVDAVSHEIIKIFTATQSTHNKLRKSAQKTSKLASWSNFIVYYQNAYDLALEEIKNNKG